MTAAAAAADVAVVAAAHCWNCAAFFSLGSTDVPVLRVVFGRRAGIRRVTMTGAGGTFGRGHVANVAIAQG